MLCGCGSGDSGCSECGCCRTCAGEEGDIGGKSKYTKKQPKRTPKEPLIFNRKSQKKPLTNRQLKIRETISWGDQKKLLESFL